jgi:hypothetical protein
MQGMFDALLCKYQDSDSSVASLSQMRMGFKLYVKIYDKA